MRSPVQNSRRIDRGGRAFAIVATTVLFTLFAPVGHSSVTLPGTNEAATIPITGDAVPGLESYDRTISDLLARWGINGAAVAVTKDGRLVYARGFGYADVDAGATVQPDSLFRVASLSKPVTAIAAMKLVQEGRLDLDAKVFTLLSDIPPPQGANIDPRLDSITVRELLEHSGGWDRARAFDPMFIPWIAADAVGEPRPASSRTIIRYMLGQPLQFDPGTEYEYSNFGYSLLGRIIEKVTGMRYDDYVRHELLAPIGVTRMICGRSRPSERATGEVKYYELPQEGLATSVFPDETQPVPWPDGGFYIEAMDSHGGWVASPIDYLRLILSADGHPSPPDALTSSSIAEMTARPANPTWQGTPIWYAKGWLVGPVDSDANWWHTGALPGTATIVVRNYNGFSWAAFYNGQPWSDQFFYEFDAGMWDAYWQVTSWPDGDQFSKYIPFEGPATPAPTARIISPNGREKLKAGTSVTISWDAGDDRKVLHQVLYLSTDGGVTYPFIIAPDVDPEARTFSFAIPASLKTKTARIKVVATDQDGNEGSDSSDANFKIKKAR